MPDFSAKAVHQFWHDYKDPIIYRVIAFMEGVEDWTLDDDAGVRTAITELGATLEEIGNIDLKQEESIIQVIAYLKSGLGLRILMCLDTAYPGAASKVLMRAEEIAKNPNDIPSIFLKRNLVFERLRLLGRVFAPDRFKLILKTLEAGGV